MGTAQVKAKSKNTKSLIEPPKVTVTIELKPEKPIPIPLLQLTNCTSCHKNNIGSLSEVKSVFQTYQRMAESPMLDAFMFKKIMPMSKKYADLVWDLLAQGDRFLSVYEIVCLIVLASYQTYRKKFQCTFHYYHSSLSYFRFRAQRICKWQTISPYLLLDVVRIL